MGSTKDGCECLLSVWLEALVMSFEQYKSHHCWERLFVKIVQELGWPSCLKRTERREWLVVGELRVKCVATWACWHFAIDWSGKIVAVNLWTVLKAAKPPDRESDLRTMPPWPNAWTYRPMMRTRSSKRPTFLVSVTRERKKMSSLSSKRSFCDIYTLFRYRNIFGSVLLESSLPTYLECAEEFPSTRYDALPYAPPHQGTLF